MRWRRGFLLPVFGLVLAAFGCRPGVLLDAEIVEQPVGGRVSEVSCTFQGTARNANGASGRLRSPVEVSTYWQSQMKYILFAPIDTYYDSTFVWYEHDEERTITSSRGAGQLRQYRFVIKWDDDRGSQRVSSDWAYVPLF